MPHALLSHFWQRSEGAWRYSGRNVSTLDLSRGKKFSIMRGVEPEYRYKHEYRSAHNRLCRLEKHRNVVSLDQLLILPFCKYMWFALIIFILFEPWC